MAVLGTQPLDELGSCSARLRELLACSLAERRRKRVHLPHRGLAVLLHPGYQSSRRVTFLPQEGVFSEKLRYLQEDLKISMDKTSMLINREKVAEARKILGTKTIADTVDAALDEVIRLQKRRRLMARIRRDGGIGPSPEELRRLREP